MTQGSGWPIPAEVAHPRKCIEHRPTLQRNLVKENARNIAKLLQDMELLQQTPGACSKRNTAGKESQIIRLDPCLIAVSHSASKDQQVTPSIIDCDGRCIIEGVQ